MLTAEKPMK